MRHVLQLSLVSGGSRGAPPPLFLDQTEAQMTEKTFFVERTLSPLSKGLDDPCFLSEGLDPPLIVYSPTSMCDLLL